MKRTVAAIVILFLCVQHGHSILPVIDYKRIASMVAKWVGITDFWDLYNKYFEGGDEIDGWLKVDDLIDKNLDWSQWGLYWEESQKLFSDEIKEGLKVLLTKAFREIDKEGIITKVFKKIDTLEDEYWIGENKIDYGEIRHYNHRYNALVTELERYNNEIAESFKKYLRVLDDTKAVDEAITKNIEQYIQSIDGLSRLTEVVQEAQLFSIITMIDFDTMMLKEEMITMIRTRLENEALMETLQQKTEKVKKTHRSKDSEAIRNAFKTQD